MAHAYRIGAGILTMSETKSKDISPVRRDWLRRLVWGGLALILLPPLLLTVALGVLDTQAGHGWLVQQINRSGVVQIGSLEGTLWGEMTLEQIQVDTPELHVNADRLVLDWTPYSLLLKRVHFPSLTLGRVDLTLKPAPPDQPPTTPPLDLRLPVSIAVDKAELGSLHITKPALAFADIHFSLSSDGRLHNFNLIQLVSLQGKTQANLSVDGNAPFSTSGRFSFLGEVEGNTIQTQGRVKGSLRDLNLNARVENPKAKGQINARLDVFAPYAYQMLREGQIKLDRINPARLLPDLPQAELDIRLDLRPTGENSAKGELAISNHRAGALNAKLLPLSSLKAALDFAGDTLNFSDLDARVGKGRIAGKGSVGAGKLSLAFDIGSLDLASLWALQPVTALNGKLSLSGPWLAPDIRADLTDAKRRVSLKTDLGWINPQKDRRLQIRLLALQRGASKLNAQGEFGLMGKQDFKLSGDFLRFNPAEYVDVPPGLISGNFKTEGALQPQPVATLDYSLADSRFNNEALQGQGHLRLTEKRIADADFWLMLGRNRIDAKGALGNTGDVLQATLNWPALKSLGKDFSGSARGVVRVSGPFSDPVLDGQMTLADLDTPFGFAVKTAQIDAHLQQGMQAPLRLSVEANQWQQGNLLLNKLQGRVGGSREQHTVELSLQGMAGKTPLQLQVDANGSLDAKNRWMGNLLQVHAQGPQALRLLAPTTLEASSERVRLGDSRWMLGKAEVVLVRTQWQAGQIESSGQISKVAIADWLTLLGTSNYASDLVLGGNWQLRLNDDFHDLNGMVSIARESGDSVWRGPIGNRVPFSLSNATLRLDAIHDQIRLQGLVQSSLYGKVVLDGDTRVDLAHGGMAEGALVNVHARGELPQLAALNPLLGPDLQLKGRLNFDVQRTGLIKNTHLAGTVQGDGLAIRDLASGLNLQDGEVRLSLVEQKVLLQRAYFKGGQGDVHAEGLLDFHEETPSGQAQIEANHLTLFSRADMLLVLSGKGDLLSQKGQISISGKLRADQGDIQYRNADIPRLSDDVVVLGRERPEARALPAFSLAVDVDLGDNFRFRGYGLDAKLEGLLRLRAQPARNLAANGVVRVKSGTYKAWGQSLDIERGQLSFQNAVDNPGLDILAVRKNQTVEAGVSVLGTALNPRVMLYSEPSVPDNEKLAWLLFGHGTDGMEKSDSVLLLQAAQSLLAGGGDGKSLTDDFLGKVGIDEVGMRSVRETDGKSTQIVTVSKQLGRNFRVSLEKSINGLRDAVKLSLQLSRRWSLVTRLGNDESSVGANYTIQFD